MKKSLCVLWAGKYGIHFRLLTLMGEEFDMWTFSCNFHHYLVMCLFLSSEYYPLTHIQIVIVWVMAALNNP